MPLRLRVLGWDHPRCTAPMRAAARLWTERHPEVIVDWEVRPGLAFAEQPLEGVTPHSDVISIDHPFVGAASATGCLVPLDELLGAGALEHAAATVGRSHRSYRFDGHLWALPTDAACQVSVVRPDLLSDIPRTLGRRPGVGARRSRTRDGVARTASGHVLIPHALRELWPSGGGNGRLICRSGRRGCGARLAPASWPSCAIRKRGRTSAHRGCRRPTTALYGPLQFGFVNYSRGEFQGRRLRFVDIPSVDGGSPVGSCLGGAGLAVSAESPCVTEAAAFAAWCMDPTIQRQVVLAHHGQPASADVWCDEDADALAGGFFSDTRATIDAAIVRPTDPWWPSFQRRARHVLSDGLRTQVDADALHTELERAWQAQMNQHRGAA